MEMGAAVPEGSAVFEEKGCPVSDAQAQAQAQGRLPAQGGLASISRETG